MKMNMLDLISSISFIYLLSCTNQPCNWRSCPGGKACLYTYFGEAKALFSYMNLQVRILLGGKTKYNFSLVGHASCVCRLEAMPPNWGQCRYVPGIYLIRMKLNISVVSLVNISSSGKILFACFVVFV